MTDPKTLAAGLSEAQRRAISLSMAKDLDRRRVTTLAKCGLLLSAMAGEGLELALDIGDSDVATLYDEVLMALAIEDQDSPDVWLDKLTREPDYSLLSERVAFVTPVDGDS